MIFRTFLANVTRPPEEDGENIASFSAELEGSDQIVDVYHSDIDDLEGIREGDRVLLTSYQTGDGETAYALTYPFTPEATASVDSEFYPNATDYDLLDPNIQNQARWLGQLNRYFSNMDGLDEQDARSLTSTLFINITE